MRNASGDIVDQSGKVLGKHEGIIHFTIGQRRGLGLGGRPEGEDALYVVRLDPASRRVIVGPRTALGIDRLVLGAVNWIGDGAHPADDVACSVKLRSTMAPVAARLLTGPDGDTFVRLDEPQFGISPGQACVFYDGDRVLGGGWILREATEIAA